MEHLFKPWQPVVVRGSDDGIWRAEFFSYYKGDDFVRPFMCTSGISYKCCLPAEGNEHLIGTTDSPAPPEPEFKFGDKVEVRNGENHEWERAYFIRKTSRIYPFSVYIGEDRVDIFRYCRHADW